MIDWVKTKVEIPPNRIPENVLHQNKAPFQWQGITFYPANGFAFNADAKSVKENGLGGLHLEIKGERYPYLMVSNSLHKFYHDGINHNDFTRTQLIESIETLSDYLGFDFYRAQLVGKLEFAVNVSVPSPSDYIENQIRYKHIEPITMKKNNKVYGKYFELTSYKVKTYSPSIAAEIQRNPKPPETSIMRTEIVCSKVSYLHSRGIYAKTLKDLTEPTILKQLGCFLSDSYKQVQLEKILPKDLPISDLQKYYFFRYATPQQLKQVRQSNQKRTYQRHQKDYKQILKKSEPLNDWVSEIPQLITDKWSSLLNA